MYRCGQGDVKPIHTLQWEIAEQQIRIHLMQAKIVDKMNTESIGGVDSCSLQGFQENHPGDANLIPTKRGNSTVGVPCSVVLPSPFRLGSWYIAIKFLFGGVFSIQWWKIVQQLKCLLINKSHNSLFCFSSSFLLINKLRKGINYLAVDDMTSSLHDNSWPRRILSNKASRAWNTVTEV